MPFKSSAQMRAAFSGALGPEMKSKALGWAHETPNIKKLPEHVKQGKGGINKESIMKNKAHFYKKAILKKHVGQGGPVWGNIGNGVRNMMNTIGTGANNLVQGAENGITKGIQGYLGNSPAGQKLSAGLASQQMKPMMTKQTLIKQNPKTTTTPLNKLKNGTSGLTNPIAAAQQRAGGASLTEN